MLCATGVHKIFNLVALSTEWPEISNTETFGGANVPFVRAHERGWTQNLRVQPCLLRGVQKSKDMCSYANPSSDAHHGT